uniref:Reverse transcriptase domain-containing protein n=1 Tax=Tanacetum cinerariifolium TaxID=118510 RepID=A0A6L2MNW6_TANCI|nr:hypothetical protein [Tanacetum cinerariifolium]
MVDQRTMAELLRAPTEGYAEAIVVPPILVEKFELKHSLINMMNSDQFFELEKDNPHDHIRSNLLERRTQDVLRIIEKKSKVRNFRNKSIVSQVKSSDANSNSSSEIAKLTHAVNQQTSVVTTVMTAILKQFKEIPPPAFVKVVEEICVTCGDAHPYYQCLIADGNTFLELRDNIQGYVAAAAVDYNQGNSGYRPSGSGSLPSNTIANPKGELKAITTRSGIVLDGPSVPIPPPFINPKEDERVEETLTDQDLAEDPLHPNIPYPSRMQKQKQQEKMKSKSINFGKSVILKKLPEKLGDPRKFLIPCGFSVLKCKALADLGPSINLMPLAVWKKLGLPELISTRMTLELANRAICTPTGIVKDVFVLVGKFTFLANFVIVDYESDLRVPFILERPFLRTYHALIDVHGEEMILQSINLINVFNDSSEDFLENLFSTNHQSGNPTFSSHPKLTSPEVKDDIFNPEGGNVLIEKLLDLDSTKDLYPPHHVNPLSGNTTSSSSSPNQLLEEFADELALITFPSRNADLSFDIDNLADLNDNLVDSMSEMFIEKHALDYSSPPLYDEYDDDLFEVESDTEYVYDDPFDSKGEKIKESKLLIDELDLPSDFLLPSEYDSFLSEDFFEVDTLPSTNNEDKVFNPGILTQENMFEVITHVAPEKKLAISHASLMLEDFDPPL